MTGGIHEGIKYTHIDMEQKEDIAKMLNESFMLEVC